MFKPELWQRHDEYRTFVSTVGHRLSRNYSKFHFSDYDEECQKLLNLNLDPLLEFIPAFYSQDGRPAKHQAQILRSLILFALLLNKTKARTSLSLWVQKILPSSVALTVLIGCTSADDLPPLGSYYDFMDRFWLAPRDSYSRSSLLPAGKNGKKPKKLIGPDGKLAEPEDTSTVTARDIANDIMAGKPAASNPEAALQRIFSILAVLPSARLGLIDTQNLTLSGDGTAVVSHSSPYGRHLPSCPKGCPYRDGCGRHYSDPDASWGWDSDNKTWYFGHTLYMLCARNNSLKVELPLLMKFTDARRHDSKNFLFAIDDFGRNAFGISPKNICLDSAHDNIPTYELLERWDINALIDINGRQSLLKVHPMTLLLINPGIPYALPGIKCAPGAMTPARTLTNTAAPLTCGRITSCPHEAECSPGNYGRTVYIKNHADLRFQPRIPRDSEEYRQIYSERTACERVNDRVLNDYCLQHMKIRGVDHFSFWTMLIGICIHLDARHKAAHLYVS